MFGEVQSFGEEQLSRQLPSEPHVYGQQSSKAPSGADSDCLSSVVQRGLCAHFPFSQQLSPSAQSPSVVQLDLHVEVSSSHTRPRHERRAPSTQTPWPSQVLTVSELRSQALPHSVAAGS